jgi:Na+/H+ antiporter NhaC
MDGNIPAFIVPAILFLAGACMSFATGSSWGTFAIMMPLAIPMAFHLDASIYVCIGAVLSGGLFGDHCSPISDTTILSSTGAGSDHMDHVKTQLPYAILNGSAALAAYIVAGLVANTLSLAVAILIMVLAVVVISKWQNKSNTGKPINM